MRLKHNNVFKASYWVENSVKYGASLDVGSDMDKERKRKPVIDDTPEVKKADEDFNDLIRKELGESPKKPDIKIEPARKAIKIEPARKSIRIEPARKPVERAKAVPKGSQTRKPIMAQRAKIKPFSSRKQPKAITPRVPKQTKPTPATPPNDGIPLQPSDLPIQPKSSGRWVSLLVMLLVAVGAVYAMGTLRGSDDADSFACASSFVDEQGGISLTFSDANAVERFWLRNAYESDDAVKSARIFHMLACEEAFLSTLSDPSAYANCSTPPVYVIVDEETLDANPVAALGEETILSKLATYGSINSFELVYRLETPDVSAWEVVE